MSVTSRPRSHADRDQILSFVAAYLAGPGADATIRSMHDLIFAAAGAAWQSARASYLSAQATWQAASAAADDADATFDSSLRKLMLSFRDEDGSNDPALNQALLGMQPSALMALRYAEEVSAGRAFLARLAARADLSPNPDRLARFQEALDALEAASAERDRALAARLSAGTAQDTAKLEFDSAWGRLVRAVQATVDEATATAFLPRFTRADAADAADAEPVDDEPTTP